MASLSKCSNKFIVIVKFTTSNAELNKFGTTAHKTRGRSFYGVVCTHRRGYGIIEFNVPLDTVCQVISETGGPEQ